MHPLIGFKKMTWGDWCNIIKLDPAAKVLDSSSDKFIKRSKWKNGFLIFRAVPEAQPILTGINDRVFWADWAETKPQEATNAQR